MRFAFVAILAVVVAVPSAAQQTEVKGHVIGESVADFARKASTSLDECRHPSRKQQKNERRTCQALLKADGGERVSFGPDDLHLYEPGELHWSYVLADRKLAQCIMTAMSIPEKGITFQGTTEDLVRQYGKPATRGTEAHQNGLGGVFQTEHAEWVMPDMSVIIAREGFFLGNTRLRTITVTFLSADEARRVAAAEENRPNIFK